MERARVRALPWPELTLIVCGLAMVIGLMVVGATPSCHQWKEQLLRISGAYLGAAGEEEHPQPESGVSAERQDLRNATRRVLDERPFGCL